MNSITTNVKFRRYIYFFESNRPIYILVIWKSEIKTNISNSIPYFQDIYFTYFFIFLLLKIYKDPKWKNYVTCLLTIDSVIKLGWISYWHYSTPVNSRKTLPFLRGMSNWRLKPFSKGATRSPCKSVRRYLFEQVRDVRVVVNGLL